MVPKIVSLFVLLLRCILSPKLYQHDGKNQQQSRFLRTFSENGNLEQTLLFTMESHILAPQSHQLFIKIVFDFSADFHLSFWHYFY